MPNLFIIGAPKSGTTALCSYLGEHSRIFVSPIKEPQFYTFDLRGGFSGSRAEYLALFEHAGPQHKWIIDGSTAYLRSECAIANILRDWPDAKFIVMLRNPVEMAFSLHAERIKHFDEDVMSFEEALDLEKERARGRRLPKDCPEPKLLQYRWFCLLGEQVERAMKAIPAGNLHVILYDDFRESPQDEYMRVLDFLGAADDGRSHFPRVNPRATFRWPAVELTLRAIRRIRAHVGFTRGLGIHALVNRFNLVESPEMLPQHLRVALTEYFRQDILLLEQQIGRDLSHWLRT